MELMGVIYGLEQLKTKSRVKVYSDSQYVINGIEKGWAKKWQSNNWFRTRTEKATNHDLWERLLTLIAAQEHVAFQWVKGHAGHPENERCDEMAMLALTGEKQEVDQGYLDALTSDSSTAPGKIMAEGNACRKCNTAVIKKPPKKKQPKPGQDYYYEYYFFCPGCKTMYFTEDAKRAVDKPADNTLFG